MAIQARQINQRSQALAGLKIEDNYFVLRRAVEMVVRTEAQSSWLLIRRAFGPEDPQKMARNGVITGVQVGRLWRFRASVLNDWLEHKMAS